ncbi:MAG: Fur family transcriptional regulator [Candidatus Altimarinota bacterium]
MSKISYKKLAAEKLQQNGFKLTKPRLMLLELLEKTDRALSPYDMKDMLAKQKIKADVVTIYRILEVLEQNALVHKILSLGRFTKCCLDDSADECHHYLICKNCHKIEEISGDDLEKLEAKIAKESGFEILSHNLELTGICGDCRKK